MEKRHKGRWESAELSEELLRVENTLRFTRLKLRYFPSDSRLDSSRLSVRGRAASGEARGRKHG
jgi:hypothetical protein